MSKITPVHLARAAHGYVRQSTADQIQHNRSVDGAGSLILIESNRAHCRLQKMRGLFGIKECEDNGPVRLRLLKYLCDSEQDSDRCRVVIGAGDVAAGIVVGAKQYRRHIGVFAGYPGHDVRQSKIFRTVWQCERLGGVGLQTKIGEPIGNVLPRPLMPSGAHLAAVFSCESGHIFHQALWVHV